MKAPGGAAGSHHRQSGGGAPGGRPAGPIGGADARGAGGGRGSPREPPSARGGRMFQSRRAARHSWPVRTPPASLNSP
eukprot:3118192-Pyramimonas_sp.AAC.2